MKRPLPAIVLLGALAASTAAARPPACAPGRFAVAGAAIGAGRANRDAIVLTATDVSIRSLACGAAPARTRVTRRGTVVKAVWRTPCGASFARARLRARIDGATCAAMTGAFRVARPGRPFGRPRRFRATRAEAVTTCTQGEDTWAVIQDRIFGRHGCTVATCHGSFAQGGLDLLADTSYASLVDVPAANPVAAAAGALRVVRGDPAASFLVRKLRADLAPGEGEPMPRVGARLAADELALVEAWIAAGAPRTGRVPAAPCLPPPDFEAAVPLAPPPGGYQLVLDGPVLQPGEEREACIWVPTPNAEDFVVGKWEFSLNPGTHHFAVFQWAKDTPPPLHQWSADPGCTSGAVFGATLSGAPQAPYFADSLPPGLGRRLPAGGYLGLNPHYANDFDEPVQVKVWVNLYPYPGTPEHVVETLTDFDDMFSIDVPPGTQKLQPGRFTNRSAAAMAFVQLAGHMHKRGLRFTARRSDGATLVESLDWAHPQWRPFEPPFVLAPGDFIDFECLHDNGVTRPPRLDASGAPTALRFGLGADDEMCTLTGVWYQAP